MSIVTADQLSTEGWSYDPTTRSITVGIVRCGSCRHNQDHIPAGRRQVFGWQRCPAACNDGKRGSGNCRKCAYWREERARHGGLPGYEPGMVRDYQAQDGGQCDTCAGTGLSHNPEIWGTGNAELPASIREQVIDSIPIEIGASDLPMGRAEQLGLNLTFGGDSSTRNIFSIVDYGQRVKEILQQVEAGTIDAYMEQLRTELTPQIHDRFRRVIDTANPNGEHRHWLVMKKVAVIIRDQGITVYGIWDTIKKGDER